MNYPTKNNGWFTGLWAVSEIRYTVKLMYNLIYETLASVTDSVTLSNIHMTKYGMIYETQASIHNPWHCQVYVQPNKETLASLGLA